MKKGFGKRCLTLGLVLAGAVGLCACGGGGGNEADPALAKENVYRIQNIELPELYDPQNGEMRVMSSAYRDGRVNLLVRITDWSVSFEDNDYRLISMNGDGSDVSVVKLEIPGLDNEDNQGNGSSNIGIMPRVSAGGAVSVATRETGRAVASEEDTGTPDGEEEDGTGTPDGEEEDGTGTPDGEEEDGTEASGEEGGAASGEEAPDVEEPIINNIYEYTNYSSFTMLSDGTVFAAKNHRIQDSSDPENYVTTNELSICSWDAEGKMLHETSLGELNDRTWISAMMEGTDDALYLIQVENNEDYSESSYYRIRIGKDGTIGERQKLSDETLPLFTNSDQIISKGDGSTFISYRDDNDWAKMYYTIYDVATDTMGDIKDFPSSISYTYDYNVMLPGRTHDLIYTGNGGIYCWDQGDEAGRLMVNYINSDLYIQSVRGLVELDDTSFLCFYQEDWNSGLRAGVFTYVAPEDIQDKKVLVLGGNYVDSALEKRVIEYNRNNAEYRIVLKEYNTYNSYDDYNAGITQLNNDIISGKMPDILVNNSYNGLPVSNYISKGLLADIDKLIAEDEELSQKEFMQNAFDAYRTDGKLYHIVPDFEIYTVIAKESLVGNRESWSMEDMQQVLAGMGEEAKAFSGNTSRNDFMNMVMRYCGNQFVDLSTGKCAFNTDDFISMMEYAKNLPAGEGENSGIYDEGYWQEYWDTYESQYRQNRTLLLEANFWRFDNLAYTINGQIGEEVSYVGFPTNGGNGSYVMSSGTYVLSAKSKNLDEAWNFMRYYLTDEGQENVGYFPTRKDFFVEKSKDALKRPTYEWTDENGETHVEEQEMSIYINGEQVKYDPLNQEQLDKLIAFIESVRNPFYTNEEVMNIINEEIEGFFTGQKPAADVADVIQRRVQNYVDENS